MGTPVLVQYDDRNMPIIFILCISKATKINFWSMSKTFAKVRLQG